MEISKSKKKITLFYGGVMNLGREMNKVSRNAELLVGIIEMVAADVRLVDLECVIADKKGEQSPVKNHNFFRAKSDQINILANFDIDIVLTANDHAGDYGAEALLEQKEYLDSARILHVGSGKNILEAFAPVYKKIGDIIIAVFSVDTIMPAFAATADKPGTAFLPVNNLERWKEIFTDKIREAHEKAHVVIIAPHWGANFAQKPTAAIRNVAHLLIDLGADAILGCNSHILQAVENYKERPIIYDAGDFLFDNGNRDAACFVLEISSDGVEKIKCIPLKINPNQTLRADAEQTETIGKNFIASCEEFKTAPKTSRGFFRNKIYSAVA